MPSSFNLMSRPKSDVILQESNKNTKPEIDISGFWEGTISRDEGYGKRVVFEIEVILTQKGKEILALLEPMTVAKHTAQKWI